MVGHQNRTAVCPKRVNIADAAAAADGDITISTYPKWPDTMCEVLLCTRHTHVMLGYIQGTRGRQ